MFELKMTSLNMQRVQPFTGQPPARVGVIACRTRVLRTQKPRVQSAIGAARNDSVIDSGLALRTALSVTLGSFGVLGLTASRALAEEVASVSGAVTISAEDAEVLAASSAGSSIDQLIVSVLFSVVVVLLVILTSGVIYINVKQWLDSRQEQEDRERGRKGPQEPASSSSAKSGSGSAGGEEGEGEVVVPLKRASRIKKEKGRGFAASDLSSRR